MRVEELICSQVEQADPKVLEFLLAYLLPMFSSTKLDDLAGSVSLTVYSLAIVTIAMVYGNVFHFNPVLAVFGYHFYVVTEAARTGEAGMKYLLISKQSFHKTNFKINVKRLDDYTFLDSGT